LVFRGGIQKDAGAKPASFHFAKGREMHKQSLMTALAAFVLLGTSAAQDAATVFHARTNVVLAPTLVLDKSGEIVRGLEARDFVVEENGVEQEIRLDESPEAQAISLVVAVQRGRSAALQLQALKKPEENGEALKSEPVKRRRHHEAALGGLGSMVWNFAGEGNCEISVVTFDRTIDLFERFTDDVPGVVERLQDLTPSGDNGAAILDAVDYSLDMLERRPKARTRVLLLISEERDHGSHIKLDEVVQHVARSNTLIYSVSFSPLRAETIRDLKAPEAQGGGNLLKLLGLAIDAAQKNSARAVAQLTGGEYSTFKNKNSFEGEMLTLANHVRGRYVLSFQPKNLQPGAHRFTVRLRDSQKGATVISRNSYWLEGSAQEESGSQETK
jgi:VWFA-related protein